MGNATTGLGLAPYVPRMAAEWDLDAAGALWREMEATCCFVDISGFTALSERLARRGRIGAEELTEVLNHVFSRMLEVAYGKGGALLKFGGDALLLAFTGDDHATLAAEAAVAMRATLRAARTLPTSVGRVSLRMSVGIHSGTFHLFHVGDDHRELLISGPAATTTTRMEAAADAGEIVMSPDTAGRLPVGAVGAVKGAGRLLRWRQVPEDGPGPVPPRAVSPAAVEASVPAGLRLRLAQRSGESEHRLANVAFVKFQGVDDLLVSAGPGAAADALDAIVRSVQHAAAAESVTFLASDIDANGGKIILTTGAPATLEDDEGRLLRTARAVADAVHPLPIRIGLNRGHVFTGDIGTEYRRTFTVMGDTVNLAARLMAAAAPGEILATAPILDQAGTRFVAEALEPFTVKGKSEPVQAYRVGAATGSRSDAYGTLSFAGRDKELTALRHAFESVSTGSGEVVLIDGERGIGKTRLVAEFLRGAGTGDVLQLQGEPQSTGVPYRPLRAAMRAVLGLDARDRQEAGVQMLSALAALDHRLVPLGPLLAPVVDAEVPSTPESEAVADEFVRQRIADLVVATLDAACGTPLLVVAEDAHWFDDTTSEICARLAAAAGTRAWLVCATRRAEALGGFEPADPVTRLSLTPLTDDVAREVVEAATENAPLRPHERDEVVSRAGGNPLFLEELLRIVRATNVESLPESLDTVAMREIDSLPTTPRRILRLASVLGRSFERSLLDRLLMAESVEVGADPLAELGGQLLPDEGGRQILRFRHALLQEAAYQSLPFRQRLALHREVGHALEGESSDDGDVVAALSLHFLAAQDWGRTWRYARQAAGAAREAHAAGEVVVHLERALTAARRLDHVDADALVMVYVDLGRTLELLGEYQRADDAYHGAALASNGDPMVRARMAHRRAHLRSEYLGRPSAAIRQLRAGRSELGDLGSDAAGLRALLIAEEANVRERQGRLAEALACARVAVAEAEGATDTRALALSLEVLNSCLMRTGHAEQADQMGRVLELYEDLGDEVQVAIALGNIAAVAFFASEWDKAAEYVARSAEASMTAGDLAGAAMSRVNLGELRVNQGRLDEAMALLAPGRRELESYGYRMMTAVATMQLGRAMAFLGDVDGGVAMVSAAADTFDEIGSHIESLEARARLAEVLVFGGRLAQAEGAVAQARALERDVGETPLSALVDRIDLMIAAARGEGAAVRARLPAFLERAQRLDALYEVLVIHSALEQAGIGRAEPEVVGFSDAVTDPRRLARALGVVTLPMLPPA